MNKSIERAYIRLRDQHCDHITAVNELLKQYDIVAILLSIRKVMLKYR